MVIGLTRFFPLLFFFINLIFYKLGIIRELLIIDEVLELFIEVPCLP